MHERAQFVVDAFLYWQPSVQIFQGWSHVFILLRFVYETRCSQWITCRRGERVAAGRQAYIEGVVTVWSYRDSTRAHITSWTVASRPRSVLTYLRRLISASTRIDSSASIQTPRSRTTHTGSTTSETALILQLAVGRVRRPAAVPYCHTTSPQSILVNSEVLHVMLMLMYKLQLHKCLAVQIIKPDMINETEKF